MRCKAIQAKLRSLISLADVFPEYCTLHWRKNNIHWLNSSHANTRVSLRCQVQVSGVDFAFRSHGYRLLKANLFTDSARWCQHFLVSTRKGKSYSVAFVNLNIESGPVSPGCKTNHRSATA